MAYCNKADVLRQLPAVQLNELLDDENDGSLIDARLAGLCEQVQQEIDVYLRRRYALPLLDTPAALAAWAVDIVIYRLFARYAASIPESRQTAYRDAIRALGEVNAGKIDLVNEAGAEPDKGRPGLRAWAV